MRCLCVGTFIVHSYGSPDLHGRMMQMSSRRRVYKCTKGNDNERMMFLFIYIIIYSVFPTKSINIT